METYTLTVEDSPDRADIDAFNQILFAHNVAQAGASESRPLAVFLRDESGKVVGGLNGRTYWGWLFVETFAIDQEARGQGYGTRLLAAAEEEARRRGCHGAFLDTFSFQALPFYEKQGYSVFGALDEFPRGHKRYFLQKPL